MDAASSMQVLIAVAILTGILVGLVRAVGTLAAASLPDLPRPAPAPVPRTDRSTLVAILTAAAAESLETEEFRVESITEVEPDHPHLGWPRIGRFQRHKPPRGLQF